MFEQTFVRAQARTRKSWTVGLSFALQACLITIALIAPLLHPERLSLTSPVPGPLIFTLPKVQIVELPPARATASPSRLVRRALLPLYGPTLIPRTIDLTPDVVEPAAAALPVAAPFEFAALPPLPPAPPPPPRPQVPAPQPAPMRVSTGVQAALLVFAPKPSYPPLAKAARIQGTVRLEALIGADGAMREVHVMSGHPLLVHAAESAVCEWRYKPTLLNGAPVEVITVIEVTFTLTGN